LIGACGIVGLVAHHSGARFEADHLAAFSFEPSPLHDALAAADLTTGPGGEGLRYAERIAEILDRYPIDDPLHRTWRLAGPIMAESVTCTQVRAATASNRDLAE
jgi:hypothetical protein